MDTPIAANKKHPLLTDAQVAFNDGVEAAKQAIRNTSVPEEGEQFKPWFINEIARTCSPFRYELSRPSLPTPAQPTTEAAAEEVFNFVIKQHSQKNQLYVSDIEWILTRHLGASGAGEAMRKACIEKVKEMGASYWEQYLKADRKFQALKETEFAAKNKAANDIAVALESLTTDTEGEGEL